MPTHIYFLLYRWQLLPHGELTERYTSKVFPSSGFTLRVQIIFACIFRYCVRYVCLRICSHMLLIWYSYLAKDLWFFFCPIYTNHPQLSHTPPDHHMWRLYTYLVVVLSLFSAQSTLNVITKPDLIYMGTYTKIRSAAKSSTQSNLDKLVFYWIHYFFFRHSCF